VVEVSCAYKRHDKMTKLSAFCCVCSSQFNITLFHITVSLKVFSLPVDACRRIYDTGCGAADDKEDT